MTRDGLKVGEHAASKIAAARRLVAAREAKFKTSADFARVVGHNPITVRAHEAGQNGIPPEIACDYSKALGVTPAWLIFGEDEEAFKLLERFDAAADRAVTFDGMADLICAIRADFRTLKANREGQTPTDVVS